MSWFFGETSGIHVLIQLALPKVEPNLPGLLQKKEKKIITLQNTKLRRNDDLWTMGVFKPKLLQVII